MTRTLDKARGLLSPKSMSGGPLAGFRNKIINGDFDIWQRGTSQTTSLYGSADRWVFNFYNITGDATRTAHTAGQTDVPGNPTYHLRLNVSAYTNQFSAYQRIEDVSTLAGKTVTLTFYARASAAVTGTPYYSQQFGSGGSSAVGYATSTVDITTSWQRFDVIFTLPSISGKTIGTSSYLAVYPLRILENFTGWIDLSRVSLVEGDATLEDDPFEARHIGQELDLCQRYYQKTTDSNSNIVSFNAVSGSTYYTSKAFVVTMRATPTITFSDHDNQVSMNNSSAFINSPDGFRAASVCNTTDVDAFIRFNFAADAEI